jgi:hypothetical protein
MNTTPTPPWFDEITRRAFHDLAVQREEMARVLIESYLPRRLRRLADHPRALRLVYRIRPAWRPTVTVGADLGVTVAVVHSADGGLSLVLKEQWS